MLSQVSRRLRVPHSTGPVSMATTTSRHSGCSSTLEQNKAICFCTSCGSPEPQNAQRSVTSTANWAPLKQGRSCSQDLNSPFIARTRDSCKKHFVFHPGNNFAADSGQHALSGWPASKLDEIECTRLDRPSPSLEVYGTRCKQSSMIGNGRLQKEHQEQTMHSTVVGACANTIPTFRPEWVHRCAW